MRTSAVRLAKSISKAPLSLHEASATLLPPIPLYRNILRVHRVLPVDMRSLGDTYVKAEFRRHKEVTNPVHIIGFLSQWKMYLDGIPRSKEDARRWKGKKLDPTVFEKMSGEQIGQLYEVMHATKDVWKNPTQLQDDARNDATSSDSTVDVDSPDRNRQ